MGLARPPLSFLKKKEKKNERKKNGDKKGKRKKNELIKGAYGLERGP